MTKTAPVDPRATVEARLQTDLDFDEPIPAGVFEYFDYHGPDGGIIFGCPCGCGETKSLSFRSERRPIWNWNGNREKPTLTPSIHILQTDERGIQTGSHWHGFLTDGVFRSC